MIEVDCQALVARRVIGQLTFARSRQMLLALTAAAADDAALHTLAAEEFLLRIFDLDSEVAEGTSDQINEPSGGDLLLLLQPLPPMKGSIRANVAWSEAGLLSEPT